MLSEYCKIFSKEEKNFEIEYESLKSTRNKLQIKLNDSNSQLENTISNEEKLLLREKIANLEKQIKELSKKITTSMLYRDTLIDSKVKQILENNSKENLSIEK